MTRGRDVPYESRTSALFSSPGVDPEETEKQASDFAPDLAADTSGGGLPSFSVASAGAPGETSSEAGPWLGSTDASGTGKSWLDGPIVPGQVLFGRYEVQRKLGDGGMGEVWLVRHLELDSERALKFVLPRYSIHESVKVRFGREARVTARFAHPNIVVVHDARLSGDAAFIEMEYIRGQSLNKLLHPGVPLPLDLIGRILDQLCDALQMAHDNQVVHRDLKPSNLMLVDGRPPGKEFLKVLDFGIAKILDYDNRDSGGRTMTEGFLGTVQYASPEQLMGQPVDGRSDVYSTAVMLYEMLTGFRPFGGTAMEQMHGHAYLPPSPMASKNPKAHVPPEVERVVMRCLAKDPAQRLQTPRELADEFLRVLDQAGVASPSRSPSGVHDVVDRYAETHEDSLASSQVETERTSALFAPGADRASHPGPQIQPPSSATRPDGPITDERPKPWLTPSRPSWLPVLTALALLAVLAGIITVVLMARRGQRQPLIPVVPPPRVELPEGISPAAREVLVRWYAEGYKADPAADVVEGWPRALVHREDGAQFYRYKGAIYLPEGYEPEGQAEAVDGWPAVLVRSRDQVRFIRIPGGSFAMGLVTNDQDKPIDPAAPARPVTLSGFYMQEFEVTNDEVEAFSRFLDNAPAHRLADWRRTFDDLRVLIKEEARKYPAVHLTHRDAETFARWVQGRLPTEAQWEYAARSRGQDRQQYAIARLDPKKLLTEQANINTWGEVGKEGEEGVHLETAPGGKFQEDRTEQGLYDLTGNVREWCRDVWEPFVAVKVPLPNPTGPPRTDSAAVTFVIRGGSFKTYEDQGQTFVRTDHEPEDQVASDLGFRLVLECPSTPQSAAPAATAR